MTLWPSSALASADDVASQESEQLGDDAFARLNPRTGAIESLEVLFFSPRLLREDVLQLPVSAELRIAAQV